MTNSNPNNATPTTGSSSGGFGRRKFLTMVGGAAAGVTVTSLPLSLLPHAAAQGGSRSLVCVMLSGGADSFNMYVPRDHSVPGQDYATYANTRGIFAVPANQLLPIGDGSFGLNPALTRMSAIANSGRLAVVQNVGPLDRPITKQDFLARRSVPQNLFAHDAQRKLWQTGRSTLTSDAGWGGSVVSAVAPGAPVSPSFSLSGSNIWQSSVAGPYSRLSPSVSIQRLGGYNPNIWTWYRSLPGVSEVLATAIADAAASPHQLDQAAARMECLARSSL